MKNKNDCKPAGSTHEDTLRIFYGHKEPQRLQQGVFPEKYSLEAGWLTPVKNQQTIGNCWTYSAMAMVETFLLRHNMLTGDLPCKEEYKTLSETYMTYSMIDFQGGHANHKGRINPTGDFGGTLHDASAFLTRQPVCVPECIDPLKPKAEQFKPRDYDIGFGKPASFRVTGLRFIEDPQGVRPDKEFVEDIKYCLMSYGAVAITLRWDKTKYMKTDAAQRPSYYCYDPADASASHGVTIVGWDDTYPKGNFRNTDGAIQPKANGAYLVKNSHGTGGNQSDGYFYLSYEDQCMSYAYCITQMRPDSSAALTDCRHYDTFGMNTFCNSDALKTTEVTYACKFTLPEKTSLTDVGVYTYTPCLADITVTPGGASIKNQKLSWAGYHVLSFATPVSIAASTEIKISVTYKTIHLIPVFIPVEKGDLAYKNAQLPKDACFINMPDGEKDLSTLSIGSYGSIPLRAYITYTAEDAAKTAAAANALRLPAEKDGILHDLPDQQSGCNVYWRLEPYHISAYQPSVVDKAAEYSLTNPNTHKVSKGIKNKEGQDAITAYLCATVTKGAYMTRRLFSVPLSRLKPAEVQATAVAPGSNVTNLSGHFDVPHSRVQAMIKRYSSSVDPSLIRTTKVDANGNWQIPAFVLYDPSGGWKDAYAHNLVEVKILADNDVVLSCGEKDVPAKRPYEPKPDPRPIPDPRPVYIVDTLVGLVAALALSKAFAYAIELKNNLTVSAAFMRSLSQLVTAEIPIEGGGYTMYFESIDTSLMDEVYEVSNLNVEFTPASGREETTEGAQASEAKPTGGANNGGGIARKVKSGGTLKNCKVTGSVNGFSNFGGLFCEGSDVTVTDCSVNLRVNGADSFGGIAVSMDRGSISGCTISCTTQNVKKTAGGVLTLGSAAAIKKTSFAIDATGCETVAGVSLECSGTVAQAQVTGSLSASGSTSTAGGIAAQLTGSSKVSDCRVSADISAVTAGGVAAKMTGSAKIERCLTAGRVTGSSACYGIAPGISGKEDHVEASVSACSHLGGQSPHRIAQYSTDCAAYEGMTCDSGKSFVGSDRLLSFSDLLAKETYTGRDWNLSSVWELSKGCPVLRGLANPGYDFPFVNLDIPEGGFVFARGKAVAVTGVCNPKAQVVWSIAPATKSARTGKAVRNGDRFSITVGILPGPAKYNFSVISILDGQRYPCPVQVQVL